MIAMSLISTYDEYRRDRLAAAPVHAAPPRPFRQTMLRALSMIGFGMGGIASADDDDTPESAERVSTC